MSVIAHPLRVLVTPQRVVAAVAVTLLVLVATPRTAALGSTEESDFQEVAGVENWSHEFPVDELEPGTYNLLLRATDSAGNQAFAGPIDIRVDPASDVPGVTISTPVNNAIVGSRLVVLGTATDDDEISQVSVRVDDGEPIIADGSEFWSASFDLSGMEEGGHTITAVATDVNGSESPPATTPFRLDVSGPVIEVTNLDSGSLVTGRVTIQGRVRDQNGIEGLTVDTPAGDVDADADPAAEREVTPLRVRSGRTDHQFTYRFDSRDRTDGPIVLWITARDTAGSSTRFPFLLFVDNTPPEVTFRAPDVEEAPAGTVTFAGTATDELSLDSLTYETASGLAGELTLTPGDPFWAVSLDLSDVRRRDTFTITAVDGAGNSTTLDKRIVLNADADLPRIEEFALVDGHAIGTARDDDGISAVEYRIGEGEWRRTATTRSVSIALPELPPGEYEIVLRGVDVFGRTGPEVSSTHVVPAALPLFTQLVLAETEEREEEPFNPGLVLYEGEARELIARMENVWGLRTLRYRRDGATEWSTVRIDHNAEDGTGSISLNLGRREEAGRHSLELEVANESGLGDRITTFYYVLQRLPEEPDPEATYLTEIPDDPGLYVAEGRWDRDGGILYFRNRRPLTAFIAQAAIEDARLEPAAEAFAVSRNGSVLRVTPVAAGRTDNVALVVETATGETYRSEQLDLVYDPDPPELRVLSPASDSWHQDEVEVRVSATDSVGDPVVEYAVGDQNFREVDLADVSSDDDVSGDTPGVYAFTVAPPEEDGSVTLRVRATDAADNTTSRVVRLNFDRSSPDIAILSPREEDQVNGRVTVIGRATDQGAVVDLRWSADGETFEPLPVSGVFSFPVDLTRYVGIDARPVLEAVDRAGNRIRTQMDFPIDAAADEPSVSIQLPPDGSVQREDFAVSGTVFDDDGVSEILARVDDGDFRSVSGGETFSIPIDVQSLGDNEHTLTVKAVDVGGVESEEVSVTFSISLESPVGFVETPTLAEFVRDEIDIVGTASDANGIRSVRLSFDNGSTFHDALPLGEEGYQRWTYPLNSTVLTDGLHALQVEVVDELGTAALFSSLVTIDNTAPTVTLDLPVEGATYHETLDISGKAVDAQRLASVEVQLTPQGEAGVDPLIAPVYMDTGGVVRERIDVSEIPEGKYDVTLLATDESDNTSTESRNVSVVRDIEERERIEVYAPFEGATLSGRLVIDGRVVTYRELDRVTVRIDDSPVGVASVGADGFFSMPANTENLAVGERAISVVAEGTGGDDLVSPDVSFRYEELGPWIQVESHRTGDAVGSRPIITGSAGYNFQAPEELEEESREYRRAVAAYEIDRVDVSVDNGATYDRAAGGASWEYRIETEEIPDGVRPVIVRVTARDGSQAHRRLLLMLDTKPPEIDLVHPREAGRFNEAVATSGTASDETAVEVVEAVLREGGKNRYEVPEFIQGLYADVHVLGASTWDLGLGLTFFDDNVKLQGQIGAAPAGRFSGLVMGAKLLANVARLPFSAFLGPNFQFLSGSLAVGANFSYFTMSDDQIGFTDEGLVLGGMVGQVEFPIVDIQGWRILNAYSLYTEGQLWFISSDVQGGVQTKVSFGLRVQLL